MTLPAESSLCTPSRSVGVESGEPSGVGRSGLATLDPKVEFMHYCPVCQCEQQFVAGWECMYGLVGCCLGCGTPRVARWTRTVGEAA